ncbi:MAG: DUF1343 domain-containing protein [Myxococcaceae bacterium]|nr:DUF1343 domain-containing protein [Myxococcaceae bacterium]
MAVKTGLDVCVAQGFSTLKGLKVGAIVNPTSVDASFRHLADLLKGSQALTLGALFGPEHGVRGEAQYMEAVGDVARDRHTGVPVYSLYGSTYESLSPKQEWLNGLDALVFDIQDVGSRYYTYVYTMALAMKAAGKKGLKFVVLDRPNPLGGECVEGNIVREKYRSFVGLFSIPNRHGMTVGELAKLFNTQDGWKCDLTVVPCEGLTRAMNWRDTGLHFVPTSPNMPTTETALVYPGMCMGEGTNVSEGRGTCRPFEQFGAPWLDATAVAERLNSDALPGVRFRPVAFTPTFDKFKGQSCEGAFLHVTDARAFKPVLTGIAVIKACHDLGGKSFEWRRDAYEFVKDIPAFDLLAGTDEVRLGIEQGATLEKLVQGFDGQLKEFQPVRASALLYG